MNPGIKSVSINPDRRELKTWRLLIVLLLPALLLSCTFAFVNNVQAQQEKSQQPKPQEKKADKPKQEETEAEDPSQTIRVGTQLVNLLFSAADKQNRYINDLTKDDIIVLEDGKPQQIFTFKKETDLPLTMAMLIDVSGSERYVLPMLKETGHRFFTSVLRPNKDTAAIVKFEGEPTLMQGLTSNPARLRKSLEDVAFVAPPPGGIYGGTTPPINGGSRQGGTSMFDAIVATAADLLAGEAGRKTMILLTDGVDTTSRMKMADAINEALRAETSIYAIGIGDPGFGIDEGGLKKLCEATGGRAYFPRGHSELDRAFAQLETDLRQQYLIAYEPENVNNDGGFRKIEIRLKSRDPKELRLRHRRGYYAPKP